MIHQHFVIWRSSSANQSANQFANQFVPEVVSALPCSSRHLCHTLLFVYFFNELISFIGSLDKCHTRVFNALIWLRYCSLSSTCSPAWHLHVVLILHSYDSSWSNKEKYIAVKHYLNNSYASL